jgi:hypothetical protein
MQVDANGVGGGLPATQDVKSKQRRPRCFHMGLGYHVGIEKLVTREPGTGNEE